MPHVTSERVLEDLRQVVHDAEELLKATAGQAGEKIAEARSRTESSLHAAKARLAELGGDATERAKAAADSADRYVRDNPWSAIAIVAAAGVLIGMLVGKRNGSGE